MHNFSHNSDDSSSDVDAPNTMDRQLDDSNKSKKKHKKHKKHKSRHADDGDGKERSSRSNKKHKKHKKKQKARDASNSNTDTDEKNKRAKHSESTKTIKATVVAVAEAETSTKSATIVATSTLNKKFTEIMKSNGRVVVATVPTTKILPNSNGSGNLIGTKHTKKIPTDPNRLVELITQSLDAKIPSMEIVSSESESDDGDVAQDLDSPDVAVIEDDELNLDDLMKQKELLQARLGAYEASDTEVEEVTMAINATMKSIDKERMAQSISIVKRPPTTDTDIILLDDSSGEAALKQKKRRKTSPIRERPARDQRPDKDRERVDRERTGTTSNAAASITERHASPDRASKARRSDNDNRYKEDLRKEIDREKERIVRDNQRRRGDRDSGRGDRRERSRYSMERDQRRPGRSGSRGGSRDRFDRRFDRDRDNYDRNRFMRDRSRNERDDRYRYSGNGGGDYRKRREEKNDKFVGSLSEGQKIERDSSSDSEVTNVNIADDDDDEEKIIEQRRKKREELLKVGFRSVSTCCLQIGVKHLFHILLLCCFFFSEI